MMVAIIIVGGSFSIGLYNGARKTHIYKELASIVQYVFQSIELVKKESTTLTKIHPVHFLQEARYKGAGVTINNYKTDPNQNDLIFMSGFFENNNELRLIERDGTLVAKWPVKFYDIFDNVSHLNYPPETNWNIDTHGALLLPDGSVVFNFEYGGLVKLDRCGKLVWKLECQTHHSVELAESGGFWVPGRRYHTKGSMKFPPFTPPLWEDTLLHISEDGKILNEISVPDIFYKNDMEALLTASGHYYTLINEWDREILHLNKVAELPTAMAKDFPMFNAGDLLLSIRDLNLVMVIDPDTQEIKWWRVGPWIRQHDPKFKAGGTIYVFNNNCYATAFGYFDMERTPAGALRVSNILEIHPETDTYRIVYGQKPGQEMLTVARGKHQLTENGGLFITEFDGGRVFETDRDGNIVWEFINRYSADEVAEITEARIYPKSYFTITDWRDCN